MKLSYEEKVFSSRQKSLEYAYGNQNKLATTYKKFAQRLYNVCLDMKVSGGALIQRDLYTSDDLCVYVFI